MCFKMPVTGIRLSLPMKKHPPGNIRCQSEKGRDVISLSWWRICRDAHHQIALNGLNDC